MQVSECDLATVSQHRWSCRRTARRDAYVVRRTRGPDGRRIIIPMHREIMNAGPGQDVNHIDDDPLNNTRENLRVCTRQQTRSCAKRWMDRSNRSPYKGVHWDRERECWRAQIAADGRVKYLGRFDDPTIAAAAYDAAALLTFGEFARLNFPLRITR